MRMAGKVCEPYAAEDGPRPRPPTARIRPKTHSGASESYVSSCVFLLGSGDCGLVSSDIISHRRRASSNRLASGRAFATAQGRGFG
jgi:hypothetical protein